jgi:hypothetical protein
MSRLSRISTHIGCPVLGSTKSSRSKGPFFEDVPAYVLSDQAFHTWQLPQWGLLNVYDPDSIAMRYGTGSGPTAPVAPTVVPGSGAARFETAIVDVDDECCVVFGPQRFIPTAGKPITFVAECIVSPALGGGDVTGTMADVHGFIGLGTTGGGRTPPASARVWRSRFPVHSVSC